MITPQWIFKVQIFSDSRALQKKPDVISRNKYFNNDLTLYQKFEKRVSQKIKYVVQNRHERERDWP